LAYDEYATSEQDHQQLFQGLRTFTVKVLSAGFSGGDGASEQAHEGGTDRKSIAMHTMSPFGTAVMGCY